MSDVTCSKQSSGFSQTSGLAYNDGYDSRTLRDLSELVHWKRELIEKRWHEFFG